MVMHPCFITSMLCLHRAKEDDAQQLSAQGRVIEVHDRRLRAQSGQGLRCDDILSSTGPVQRR